MGEAQRSLVLYRQADNPVPEGRLKVKLVQIKLRNFFIPSKNRGVPHISLVFREMWDTTALDVLLSEG